MSTIAARRVLARGAEIERIIARLAHQILEPNEASNGLVLLGVRRGGESLAMRLASEIERISGHAPALGFLNINLYRDEPVLQLPFRLLAALMSVDELMTLWRYRHALMVQRMIGVKIGTGGSAGHDYLRDTAARHRIFSDLFRLSTYLIPRSRLPALPRELEDAMGYRYSAKPAKS